MLVLLLGSKTLFGGLVLKFQRNWSNVIKTVALQKEQSKDSIMRTKFPGPLVMEKLKEKRASLVAQMVKNLPATQETWVQLLGWEGPLEKEIATHSSVLVWRIPWTEEPGGYSPWNRKESDTTEQLTHTRAGAPA